MTSSWRCYKTQLRYLNAMLTRFREMGRVPEEIPKLTSLEKWEGGIKNVDKLISDMLQARGLEVSLKAFVRIKLRFFQGVLKDGQATNRTVQPKTQWQSTDNIENQLTVLKVWLKNVHDAGLLSCNSLRELLDYPITRDPEAYLAWLSTEGEACYMEFKAHGISWEQWCNTLAPAQYELCHPQKDVGLRIVNEVPHFKFETRDTSKGVYRKYGAPHDRPPITFKEAQRGHEAWKAAAGMATSQEARACFWAITGRGCMETLL